MAVNTQDLNLLADDCFESLVIDYSTNNQHLTKIQGMISRYLATGEDIGLNPETKRLVDSLIAYFHYQMETRTQSVSTDSSTSQNSPVNL